MKNKRKYPRPGSGSAPSLLEDRADPMPSTSADASAMIRTQIYLSRAEYDFLQAESRRRDEPMAAVIRSFIDERMIVPEEAWEENPLLQPPVPDPVWEGHEDGAMNHDHYIHGTPKKWMKRDGKWVETPPLPEDYYTNPPARRAYDEEVNRWT